LKYKGLMRAANGDTLDNSSSALCSNISII
jgi:hypothetical protein